MMLWISFKEFHTTMVPSKGFSTSFLALIPKKDHLQILRESRPICLIGGIYKILTKVLAKRLKGVLIGLGSSCQSAFLPARRIQNEVLVVNELFDLAK